MTDPATAGPDYVLVPVEPTQEMVEAGWCQMDMPPSGSDVIDAYRAMLAARPTIPTHKGGETTYRPVIAEYPDSGRVEFILADRPVVYEDVGNYQRLRDMDSGEIIGFAWASGTLPEVPAKPAVQQKATAGQVEDALQAWRSCERLPNVVRYMTPAVLATGLEAALSVAAPAPAEKVEPHPD